MVSWNTTAGRCVWNSYVVRLDRIITMLYWYIIMLFLLWQIIAHTGWLWQIKQLLEITWCNTVILITWGNSSGLVLYTPWGVGLCPMSSFILFNKDYSYQYVIGESFTYLAAPVLYEWHYSYIHHNRPPPPSLPSSRSATCIWNCWETDKKNYNANCEIVRYSVRDYNSLWNARYCCSIPASFWKIRPISQSDVVVALEFTG